MIQGIKLFNIHIFSMPFIMHTFELKNTENEGVLVKLMRMTKEKRSDHSTLH